MAVVSRSAGRARQDRTGTPSTRTVQVPHSPSSQPCLVPMRPRSSRSTSRRVLCTGTSASWVSPFTVRLTRVFIGSVTRFTGNESRLKNTESQHPRQEADFKREFSFLIISPTGGGANPVGDHLVLGILIWIGSCTVALLVISAVALHRSEVARHAEGVRLRRILADSERVARQELRLLRQEVDAVRRQLEEALPQQVEAVAALQERQTAALADRL